VINPDVPRAGVLPFRLLDGLLEAHDFDVDRLCREIHLAQEAGEPPDQGGHRAYEKPARRPSQIGRQKIVHEERHDHETHEQRTRSAEIDGPACKPSPSLEVSQLGECQLVCVFVELPPGLLDVTGAVYDAREPVRHDREQSRDAGKQKYRSDGKLYCM
jgi:hypothetical protein